MLSTEIRISVGGLSIVSIVTIPRPCCHQPQNGLGCEIRKLNKRRRCKMPPPDQANTGTGHRTYKDRTDLGRPWIMFDTENVERLDTMSVPAWVCNILELSCKCSQSRAVTDHWCLCSTVLSPYSHPVILRNIHAVPRRRFACQTSSPISCQTLLRQHAHIVLAPSASPKGTLTLCQNCSCDEPLRSVG